MEHDCQISGATEDPAGLMLGWAAVERDTRMLSGALFPLESERDLSPRVVLRMLLPWTGRSGERSSWCCDRLHEGGAAILKMSTLESSDVLHTEVKALVSLAKCRARPPWVPCGMQLFGP